MKLKDKILEMVTLAELEGREIDYILVCNSLINSYENLEWFLSASRYSIIPTVDWFLSGEILVIYKQ